MSWIDQAQDKLIIITGDGREYRPLWTAPKKVIEYNVSQFEFPGVKGSIVSRGTPKGRKFPMEIYFVGENHLEECQRFEDSAEDTRHWVVTHPYYGIFNAKASSMSVDHSGGNVSKIDLSLIETIIENNPKGVVTPSDKILQGGAQFSDRMNTALLTNVPVPTTLDKNVMTKNITGFYNDAQNKIKETEDADNYLNLYTEATTAILNATDVPLRAITAMQTFINAPFQFVDTVQNRINMLRSQFEKLVTSVENVTDLFVTHTQRRIYEHNAGLLISSIAQATITDADYLSSEDVLRTTESLIGLYDEYVANLDELQSANGGDEDSYIPDAEAMISLQELVNLTVSKLLEIALDSKQERTLITEYDTNVIILAHRLYGLEEDDSTINYLIDTNGFGGNDLIQIPAGRKVKYYV